MLKAIIGLLLLAPFTLVAQGWLTIGARSNFMGNSSVKLIDVWAFHHNPGAIVQLEKQAICISYENRFLLKELQSQGLVYGQALKKGVISFGAQTYGFKTYRTNRVGLGYSMKLSEKFSAGVQLNYQNIRLTENYGSKNTVTAELGILAKITDKWRRAGQANSDFVNFFTSRIQGCVINQLDGSGNGLNSNRVLFGAEAVSNVIAAGQTVQQRCLVGNPGNNGNIGTADYVQGTSGYANIDHITKLKYMARIGGRKLNTDCRIKPLSMSSWNGSQNEIYVYFISPSVEARLLNDPRIQSLLSRALIEDPRQPSYFNGSHYVGRIKGVDIITIDEFENMNIANAAGNAVGYGVFCGAGAIASAICSEPKFTYQEDDHGNQKEIGITLIDGLKSIKFPSKLNPTTVPPLEYGMIHSFTLI